MIVSIKFCILKTWYSQILKITEIEIFLRVDGAGVILNINGHKKLYFEWGLRNTTNDRSLFVQTKPYHGYWRLQDYD